MNTFDSLLKSKSAVKPGRTVLAERGKRFVASLIDWFLLLVIAAPAASVLSMLGIPVIAGCMLGVAAGASAFCAYNFRMLETKGQTLGKRIMGIRIVGVNGSVLPAKTVLLKRYLPVWIAVVIPFLGGLLVIIDALLIFRDEQQCGHDIFAETKIVEQSVSAFEV